MKEVKKCSISGIAFTLDIDAHTLLEEYLDSLKRAYADTPDGNEIVADIEARIAELILSRQENTQVVDAPLIDELSVALECRLIDYNPETCILRGEIVNVAVDERVLDAQGNVDPARVGAITFDPFNNAYLKIGEKVADAFSAGRQLKQC